MSVSCSLIYFWLCRLFLAARDFFSLVAASRGSSLVAARGSLVVVASLAAQHGLWGAQAQQLRLWALEHRLRSRGARA